MNYLEDERAKKLLIKIVGISLLLMILTVFISYGISNSLKNFLIEDRAAMAGSLLEQGVSEEIVAKSLMNDLGNSEEGMKLLSKLGLKESTNILFVKGLSKFNLILTAKLLIVVLIFSAIMGIFITSFLKERERTYEDAGRIIGQFKKGNFGEHLPRKERGALFQLFSEVDDLSMILKTKIEREVEGKRFIRDTVSDISHQLKTPLSAISIYNEIIIEERENPEKVVEFSEKIRTSITRVQDLIVLLLKITRLDSGSIEFEKQEYYIGDLVSKSIDQLRDRAIKEGKNLIVKGDENEKIICDLQWTSEAIGNIVKNAIDYSKGGDEISISWSKSPTATEIIISDNGRGIGEEDIHHIFKRFYRGKNSEDFQSVGLGLPLAKSIVEGQNGILTVESTIGAGTAFTLSFLTKL
ncbi:sensor histidine kinase [Anaerosphaera multitolerans]|uniref:histidine kinase n=1 Tax=Anaerosphaera multitolerans TaxID=2487351 RepID=A0A437S8Q7_9FIRM|nr:HAMP domain-containing sensor histidine kinase [Anaerosphaera multitolerans]RVU55485.1 sensor histidine kinase [Anaerosphaera multitolerans]